MKNKSKNNNKKNNSRTKLTKLIIILVLLLAAAIGIYFFLNAPDNSTKLTLFEKQWIDKNKNNLFNIEIPNNLNIYGEDGEGVLFDYVTYLENETNLTFNKNPYNYPSDNEEQEDQAGLRMIVLSNKDTLKKDDVIIGEDKYVLISADNNIIDNFNELSTQKIGILENDKEIITNIYSNNFASYSNIDNLIDDIKSKKIEYAIVPRHYCLSKIVENKLYINYDFTDLSNKIILRMSTNDKLNSVVSKYLSKYKEELFISDYNKEFMNFYTKIMNISDADKVSLSSKTYKYGYVKTSAYNLINNKEIYSVAGQYINTLKNMDNIDFSYVKYDTKEELLNDIKSNKVDLAFIDFEYNDENSSYTNISSSSLVALSKDYINLNGKDGLMNQKIYVYGSENLYNYINNNYNANTSTIKKISEYNDGILLMDEVDYLNNRDDLSDYNLIFKDLYLSGNGFYVSSNETVLYSLLNFITSYADNDNIKSLGMKSIVDNSSNTKNFNSLYILLLSIVLIPVVLIILIVMISKINTKLKKTKKENVLKYNDMLTSLKNRNYLNANIDSWDETKIYPRTIIMLDLNNLKYVNDNYGHEEGNKLIKRAAAILINTQLEKSEIIRSDGNEFLVYLIGYNEKQINTYINKLTKEFDKLPHGFGVATGYSMIEDEIKTIDDAINEASIAMRKDKQENK
jgi:diguanylate cyclase (GGDEF)-like protein